MPNARMADAADLKSLLALFEASDVSRCAQPSERAERIWAATLARDGLAVFVSDADSRIVSTCMLITVPNLLRGGRQHGIIENVVTHAEYQGRGHGRAVIGAALDEAWRQDCHHVLLQSGRTDPRVHRFYEQCGFKPGLRTAYAAHRPADQN
jgi:GNAT superfamily N-acetyltransferase